MCDYISRKDAIDAVHKYFVDAFNNEPHEIDEDGDDVFTDMKSVNALLHHNKMMSKALKALPAAELILQTPQTYGKSINPSNAEVVADYISRTDAIEAVGEWMQKEYGYLDLNRAERLIDALSALPSADAVQGWIPCSERLPLVGGEFLVTLVDQDGAWVSTAQWNMTFGGRWQDIFPNDGYRDISNVIAWKTLPMPYTKGENDEER